MSTLTSPATSTSKPEPPKDKRKHTMPALPHVPLVQTTREPPNPFYLPRSGTGRVPRSSRQPRRTQSRRCPAAEAAGAADTDVAAAGEKKQEFPAAAGPKPEIASSQRRANKRHVRAQRRQIDSDAVAALDRLTAACDEGQIDRLEWMKRAMLVAGAVSARLDALEEAEAEVRHLQVTDGYLSSSSGGFLSSGAEGAFVCLCAGIETLGGERGCEACRRRKQDLDELADEDEVEDEDENLDDEEKRGQTGDEGHEAGIGDGEVWEASTYRSSASEDLSDSGSEDSITFGSTRRILTYD